MDAPCSYVIRTQRGGGIEQILSNKKPPVPVLVTWEEALSISK